MDPSTWEGAAFVMGNSTTQWTASYNSTFKKRAVQGAVAVHTTFIANMASRGRDRDGGGGDGEDEEGRESRRIAHILISSQPGRRRKKNGGSYLNKGRKQMVWGGDWRSW